MQAPGLTRRRGRRRRRISEARPEVRATVAGLFDELPVALVAFREDLRNDGGDPREQAEVEEGAEGQEYPPAPVRDGRAADLAAQPKCFNITEDSTVAVHPARASAAA